MSDKVDPLTTESSAELHLSHRRILVIMASVAVAGFVIAAVFFDIRAGLGVVVGAGMAFANYFWQRRSMRRMFEKALAGEKVFLPAFAYILRYVALGLIVWFFYATGALPVAAVVAGFGSFSLAIVIEGLIGIFNGPK